MQLHRLIALLILYSLAICSTQILQEEIPALTTIEEKLVTDIVNAQKDSTNIVCISQQDTHPALTALDWGDNTYMLLDYDTVTKDVFKKLHSTYNLDNKAPLYLVILPSVYNEHRLVNITEEIRAAEPLTKIITICREEVIKEDIPQNIYNIYIFVPVAQGLVFVYDVCKYCDHGIDVIELSNVWTLKSGFRDPLKLVNSFKGSFNGAEIRFGCAQWFPAAYIH